MDLVEVVSGVGVDKPGIGSMSLSQSSSSPSTQVVVVPPDSVVTIKLPLLPLLALEETLLDPEVVAEPPLVVVVGASVSDSSGMRGSSEAQSSSVICEAIAAASSEDGLAEPEAELLSEAESVSEAELAVVVPKMLSNQPPVLEELEALADPEPEEPDSLESTEVEEADTVAELLLLLPGLGVTGSASVVGS